jgi:mannose-1-phosphate guanylyltransferase
LSTPRRPKQLLDLDGKGVLILQTLNRISKLADPERISIITSKDLREDLHDHLTDFEGVKVIGEPVGRNTAPAVALGAILALKEDPKAITGVFPSDHKIANEEAFLEVLSGAIDVAAGGEFLVTIGIKPTRAETGYGYVSKGEVLEAHGSAFRVGRFTEKPDLRTACHFLNSGVHLWNSGMFVWKASTVLKSIADHLPDLSKQVERLSNQLDSDRESAIDEFYRNAPSISIDYGVMEKADNVAVVEADFGWDDLGAWDCVERLKEKDSRGNAVMGDAQLIDTNGCTVISENGTVGIIGVEDVIVVHTREATLVCAKRDAQRVRSIVQAIEEKGNRTKES